MRTEVTLEFAANPILGPPAGTGVLRRSEWHPVLRGEGLVTQSVPYVDVEVAESSLAKLAVARPTLATHDEWEEGAMNLALVTVRLRLT
jgi:hypothetical protein